MRKSYKILTNEIINFLKEYGDCFNLQFYLGVPFSPSHNLCLNNHLLDNLEINSTTNKIIVKDYDTLIKLICLSMLLNGKECDLNFLDVSQVEYFNELFSKQEEVFIKFTSTFYQKIKNNEIKNYSFHFNVLKKLKDFDFYRNKYPNITFLVNKHLFNGFINEWNVSNGVYFTKMFLGAKFNQHELNFDFSNALGLDAMFKDSHYNKPFIGENTNKLRTSRRMFENSRTTKSIKLDLSHCKDISHVFNSPQIKLNQIKNIKFRDSQKELKNSEYFIKNCVNLPLLYSVNTSNKENNELSLVKMINSLSFNKLKNFLELDGIDSTLTLLNTIQSLKKLKEFHDVSFITKKHKNYIKQSFHHHLSVAFIHLNAHKSLEKDIEDNIIKDLRDCLDFYSKNINKNNKEMIENNKDLFIRLNIDINNIIKPQHLLKI